jgi:ABC-2 type transport system ATP-binding protein
MSLAVDLRGITKFYGAHGALKDVTMALEAGHFYILLGKNGAGKSTLMRLLMRYEVADRGLGRVLGESLECERDEFNQNVGFVSEALDYQLPMRMRTLFSYFEEIYPRWDRKLFESLLGELHIDLNRYFKELSRGQKMQVAFAAAAAVRPKLLILDEITSVLDANARGFFMDYLGAFVREGGTVVMATNIVSEVQNYADHVILLHEGTVSLNVAVAELPKLFVKVRHLPQDMHPLFDHAECVEVALNSDGSTSAVASVELARSFNLPPSFIDHRGITAEEIFIYFTRRGGGMAHGHEPKAA